MKLFTVSLFIFFIASLSPFSSAQIYNEDFSRQQKTNLFKDNKVWMVYGWTFLYPKGVQEKKGKKTSFERFDRNGNRTEEIYYDRKGNTAHSCNFLYDENGNEIKRMGNESNEVIYEQWNYTSMDPGRVVERKSQFKKAKAEKWVYNFNSGKNKTEEIYYDINGTISYRWEYIYDDKQNVIEKNEYDPYGNVYQKWIYYYDEKGNNIEMHHFVSNNQLHRIYKMRYDKKGNMKSRFSFDKSEKLIDLTVFIYQFYGGLHAARTLGSK